MVTQPRTIAALVFAIGLAFVPTPADAYQILGAGALSCGGWTAARQSRDLSFAGSLESWVLGFLSGIGYMGSDDVDPMRGLDNYAVAGWIDNYCGAHPLEKIVDAARALYRAHPD